MRSLTAVALLAALSFGPAFAAASTPVDYDTAAVLGETADVGTFGQALSFNVAAGLVDLNVMKPGETYTVTIPVANTTDRDITVSLEHVELTSGSDSVASTVLSGDVTITPGGTQNLTIKVTTKAAADVVAGSKITLKYDVLGVTSY
ncbi:hypothetical protein GCM10008956_02930 [Deinococcus arenae]|uniref:DUF11 domain-containing protein n=1 Tax=Deinococcus arenae TaxID=1452751 RepID=A0A8H9L594_9DEIO|nr:hypothetical protein GCM10008956_02930 [Deinococcus arenae]